MTQQNRIHTLITGASSGLGAGLAERFARQGEVVWLCARRKDKLKAVQQKIKADGGEAHVVVLDVSDANKIKKVLQGIDKKCGGIDRVIACAGIAGELSDDQLLEAEFDQFRAILDVNFVGAIATITALIPQMKLRGRGHLVGISSIAGDIPLPKGGIYGATKAGFTFFLEAAALELLAENIDVTIVHPGFVKTAMTEHASFHMPLLMSLEEAVEIMERGISARKKMVRFPFLLGFVARIGNVLPRWFLHWFLPQVAK